MTSEGVPLSGGAVTEGVVRVGDTVRRPPGHASQMMRDVLLHLERVGFDAAPRWLGLDEKGRDILSWIEGETYTDRSQMHPYIGDPTDRVTFSDEQVASAMLIHSPRAARSPSASLLTATTRSSSRSLSSARKASMVILCHPKMSFL